MRSNKEFFRLFWVLLTNGLMLYETVPSLFAYSSGHFRMSQWSVESAVAVAVLVSGGVLEIKKARLAKYFNIGFYLYRALWGVFGILAATLHALGYTNESWIFFYVVAVPCLFVAGINYFLYRGGPS